MGRWKDARVTGNKCRPTRREFAILNDELYQAKAHGAVEFSENGIDLENYVLAPKYKKRLRCTMAFLEVQSQQKAPLDGVAAMECGEIKLS